MVDSNSNILAIMASDIPRDVKMCCSFFALESINKKVVVLYFHNKQFDVG